MSNDTLQQARQAISNALERALPDHPDLDWTHGLGSEAGLDSVQIMNLVMEIEEELDISVPIEVLADVSTLDQLCAQLARLLENGA